jgi:membrane protein
MKYLKIAGRSIVDFFKDGGIMLAASISYFTMMSMVPFCLILITIFGYFLGHYEGFYQFFSSKLASFFPSITSQITQEFQKLIEFKVIGTLSLALYALLSYQFFSALENALNVIFKTGKKRHFFWSIILSVIIITLIMIILVASFVASSIVPLLKTLKTMYPYLRIGLITGFFIGYIIPFFIILLTLTVLYILLPKTKVRSSYALRGALFTTVFLEIAKHVFTWYVGTVAKFGTIYGPLTAFVIFLLWVYYSSCIFLIGAEIVHNQGQYKK